MATRYYAVREGKIPGVYATWEECRQQVEGWSGADYKAFRTKREAQAYVKGEDAVGNDGAFLEIPACPADTVIAYVDGSFDAEAVRYAYGCVLVPGGKDLERLSGTGDLAEAVSARNVAGELLGTMVAVQWAAKNGYGKIDIYHDYTGIAKWYTRAWKADSFVARSYMEFMEKYRGKMQITFHKVEAHTGVSLNEEADRLAKEALGLKK